MNMTRKNKVKEAISLVKGKTNPCMMKIYIKKRPHDEPIFFGEAPWGIDISINCPDTDEARALIELLTT